MTDRRRVDLVLALSGIAGIQADFETPMPETALDTAWPVTSDSYPNVSYEIDRLLSCDQQELIGKEVFRRLVKFDFDYDSDPALMAVHLAYLMGVAAAPTGVPANEVQTLTNTATGGKVRLGVQVGAFTKYTSFVPYNVTAAALKTALENVNAIGRGNVGVTLVAGVYTVTYQNNLANADMPNLVVDGSLLVGGAWAFATTTPGVQLLHHLTRISGFQPPATSIAAGFRNSDKLMKFYKSVITDSFKANGTHTNPRITTNWAMVASGEPALVSSTFVPPICSIFRAARFRDTRLIIDGVDYSLLLRDFEVNASNGLITDDDAYTAQDEDIHRAERADHRVFTINAGLLGEQGDVIHDLAQSLGEVPVSLRLGRSGRNITFVIPKGSISLRDPVLGYDGTAKRSKVNIQIEAELIPGDATTPWTVNASIPTTETLLEVAV